MRVREERILTSINSAVLSPKRMAKLRISMNWIEFAWFCGIFHIIKSNLGDLTWLQNSLWFCPQKSGFIPATQLHSLTVWENIWKYDDEVDGMGCPIWDFWARPSIWWVQKYPSRRTPRWFHIVFKGRLRTTFVSRRFFDLEWTSF